MLNCGIYMHASLYQPYLTFGQLAEFGQEDYFVLSIENVAASQLMRNPRSYPQVHGFGQASNGYVFCPHAEGLIQAFLLLKMFVSTLMADRLKLGVFLLYLYFSCLDSL